ncbi:hypothetical protein, partial [Mesobacillus maritimus]|uniref:hypothetical protein n=1 Tax=Mesobacillus maritimus TaxID=1643336 RepID=UPI001C8E9BB5
YEKQQGDFVYVYDKPSQRHYENQQEDFVYDKRSQRHYENQQEDFVYDKRSQGHYENQQEDFVHDKLSRIRLKVFKGFMFVSPLSTYT